RRLSRARRAFAETESARTWRFRPRNYEIRSESTLACDPAPADVECGGSRLAGGRAYFVSSGVVVLMRRVARIQLRLSHVRRRASGGGGRGQGTGSGGSKARRGRGSRPRGSERPPR